MTNSVSSYLRHDKKKLKSLLYLSAHHVFRENEKDSKWIAIRYQLRVGVEYVSGAHLMSLPIVVRCEEPNVWGLIYVEAK